MCENCNVCGECGWAQEIDNDEYFCHIKERMVDVEGNACGDFEDEEYGVYA